MHKKELLPWISEVSTAFFFTQLEKKQLHTTADQNYVYVNIQLKEKHVEIQLSLLLLNYM